MNIPVFIRCGIVTAALLAIGYATYANSMHNPFVLDDHEFFNSPRTDIRSIAHEFVPPHERWMQPGVRVIDSYYRPLAHVLPVLSYRIFGNNTVGHRLINLMLLVMAALMIYAFTRSIAGDNFLAFCAAAFYLVHPLNGILVNHIAASVFSVQVIFMLASLLCVIASEAKQSLKNIIFSLFFFILALMCHETSMALPFYILPVLVFVRHYSFKDALLKTLPFFLFLAVYFVFRLKFASLNTGILANYALFHMNFGEYLASVSKLIFWYLGQLLSPGAVVPIWATVVVRHAAGWWLAALLLLVLGWSVAIYQLRNRPLTALGLTWLGIGFIPVFFACLFQPTRAALIIEPHWFAFSSIGFFIFLGSVIARSKATKQSLILSLLFIIPWIFLSRGYNTLWSNEINYCHYWMRNAPDFKGAISFELAQAYELQGQYDLAQIYYRRGLTSHPNDWLRYHSRLGLMALKEGRWQEAREHFISALGIDPHSAVNLNNAGASFLQEGNKALAQQYFLNSISEDPYLLLPRLNLAEMYNANGDWQSTVRVYKDILKIVPQDEMTRIRLLKVYWEHTDRDNIIATAKELAVHSQNPLTQRNVRIILRSFQ